MFKEREENHGSLWSAFVPSGGQEEVCAIDCMHFYVQAGPYGTHPSTYEHLIGNILLDLNTLSAVALVTSSTHLQLPPPDSLEFY